MRSGARHDVPLDLVGNLLVEDLVVVGLRGNVHIEHLVAHLGRVHPRSATGLASKRAFGVSVPMPPALAGTAEGALLGKSQPFLILLLDLLRISSPSTKSGAILVLSSLGGDIRRVVVLGRLLVRLLRGPCR